MRTHRRAAKRLQEQNLREKFISLKKIFEEETQNQNNIESRFQTQIQTLQSQLHDLESQIQTSELQTRLWNEENQTLSKQISDTDKLLEKIVRDFEEQRAALQNELEQTRFQVLRKENEAIRKLEKTKFDNQQKIGAEWREVQIRVGKKREEAVLAKQRVVREMTRRNDQNADNFRNQCRIIKQKVHIRTDAELKAKKQVVEMENRHAHVLQRAKDELAELHETLYQIIAGSRLSFSEYTCSISIY